MSIDFNMIKSEVENLARELNRHKDEDLSHKDKIAVSDLLAETVHMIRRKYEITTMYYMASEIKAADGVGPAAKDDKIEAEWIRRGDSGIAVYECSSCGSADCIAMPFCHTCGKRMRGESND